MVRPGKKAVQGILAFLGALAFALFAVNSMIGELPTQDRSSAWRWFFAGWAASFVALLLYLLPYWIRGSIKRMDPGREEEMQYYIRIMPWAAGALGALSAGMGLATPSITVGLLSLACGGLTALLLLGLALNTTKKGRAMLDKARANQ